MSTVVIAIGGTDQTADVLFEGAHFESQVNGIAGSATMRIRDLDRTKTFTVGQTLTLQIDGEMVWRGYVATVNRVYVFPALNVTEFGLARFIDITGVDVNILFNKRFVFDQATPTNISAPLLPEHYPDDDAIATLIADWLDLSGDGLDTSSLVENVGDTTWTQEGRAWEGSDSWGQAMASIANLPAAIYYIDPDLNLVYTDVDTPNAAFGLSDQYNGTTTKGYSEMEVLMDGTALANDVLAWGAGYGSNAPVFVRDEDATSQAAHGLWQLAQISFGVYKQTTIERIAASIIDGSPQSKRGAKNDKVAVMCVTYQPGLRVAQKVDFTSNVFGFNDVIPIRKMEIDFLAPDSPKYSLVLSHEIDTPFSFFDPFMLNFSLHPPKVKCPPPLVMGPNGVCILPPIHGPITCPVGCLLASCAWDDFDRTVASPDWGGDWDTTSSNAAGGGISGGVPNMADVAFISKTRSTTVTYNEAGTRRLDLGCDDTPAPWDYYVAWTANGNFNSYDVTSTEGSPTPGSVFFPGAVHEFDVGILTTVPQQFLQFWFVAGGRGATPSNPTMVRIAMDSGSAMWTLGNIGLSTSFQTPTSFSWTPGHTYKVHVQLDADGKTRANLWDAAGSEPVGWAVTRTATWGDEDANRPTIFGTSFVRGLQAGSLSANPLNNTFDFDSVRVDLQCGDFASGIVQFDNFDRTVPSGWGNATPGGETWTVSNSGGTQSVGSGIGVMTTGSGGLGDATALLPVWPVTPGDDITLTTLVRYVDTQSPTGSHFRFIVDGVYTIECNENPDTILIKTNGGGTYTYSTSIDLFQYFYIKINISTVAFNVKAWQAGTAEPSVWMSGDPSVAFEGFNVQYQLREGASSPHLTLNVESLDLDYAGSPCFPNGPDPIQTPPLNAYVCENQTSGGSATIVTAHAFLPGSSSVWVNGILQPQPGYTENPSGKSITLSFSPDFGNTVKVCYFSVPG